MVNDIEKFTSMDALLQTVADIVHCEPTDIQVIALQPVNSFVITLTMKEDLVIKLKDTDPSNLLKLLPYKVDWIRIEDNVINIVGGEFYTFSGITLY